jgi:hypothetical protein
MILIEKITIVQTICFIYNCLEFKGTDVRRKDCEIMNKREELIGRIEKLTDEQFKLLINLWIQQERESVPISQSDHQTSLQPSA